MQLIDGNIQWGRAAGRPRDRGDRRGSAGAPRVALEVNVEAAGAPRRAVRAAAARTRRIVCGDLNSGWRDEAYPRLLAPIGGASGLVDAWTCRHPGATPPPTAGVYDTAQWQDGAMTCDFVFVTDTLAERILRCEIDGTTRASDHQPILLELRDA